MKSTLVAIVLLSSTALAWSVRQGGGAQEPAARRDQQRPQEGHLVLVVEGDRDSLGVTFAQQKNTPCPHTPSDLRSEWTLRLVDLTGNTLATVPLDLSGFDVRAEGKGLPDRVTGCVVRSSRIAKLVNAPLRAGVVAYVFERIEGDGKRVEVGRLERDRLLQLLGGRR